ncbi:MAG: hypothetical protein QOG89_507 [Thermomicrobiales bacterium]|nr:hypothetical protein [Thermomicrobiales bacterium]
MYEGWSLRVGSWDFALKGPLPRPPPRGYPAQAWERGASLRAWGKERGGGVGAAPAGVEVRYGATGRGKGLRT